MATSTTMKIDKNTLQHLKKQAKDNFRSPQQQIKYLLSIAPKSGQALPAAENVDEFDLAVAAMDEIVHNSENGIVTDEERAYALDLINSGVELFGSEESEHSPNV